MNYFLPHLNDLPATNDPALISELQDISRETLRDITVAIFGTNLLWVFVGAMTWPVELGPKIWISAFAFLPFLGLTFWLLPRQISLARATLQASLLIGIAPAAFRQGAGALDPARRAHRFPRAADLVRENQRQPGSQRGWQNGACPPQRDRSGYAGADISSWGSA